MSTILNALRRLEEDASAGETQPTDSLPATDPRATDELRSRILEEEQAAAVRAEQHSQSLIARPLLRALAAAAVLLTAIGLGVFVIAPRFASTDSRISSTTNPTALAAPVPAPTSALQLETIASANPPAVAIRPPQLDPPAPNPTSMPARPPSNEPRLATAALTPTPAMREATVAIQAATATATDTATAIGVPTPTTSAETAIEPAPTRPSSRPSNQASTASPTLHDSRRHTLERALEQASDSASTPARKTQPRPIPSSNLARTASVAAPPNPIGSAVIRIDSLPVADESTAANSIGPSIQTRSQSEIESPTESTAERATDKNPAPILAPAPSVQQHVPAPTPDIAVLQTAWHPTPDHRSAKIRMLESEETLTLREGDAVGPLVVQQITPSAVIFRSGDIELRLRVGQPGSGR